MLVIATIGLIVNIVLTVILMRSLKNEQNINVQSALWHFVGDLLNSVGVILEFTNTFHRYTIIRSYFKYGHFNHYF